MRRREEEKRNVEDEELTEQHFHDDLEDRQVDESMGMEYI